MQVRVPTPPPSAGASTRTTALTHSIVKGQSLVWLGAEDCYDLSFFQITRYCLRFALWNHQKTAQAAKRFIVHIYKSMFDVLIIDPRA